MSSATPQKTFSDIEDARFSAIQGFQENHKELFDSWYKSKDDNYKAIVATLQEEVTRQALAIADSSEMGYQICDKDGKRWKQLSEMEKNAMVKHISGRINTRKAWYSFDNLFQFMIRPSPSYRESHNMCNHVFEDEVVQLQKDGKMGKNLPKEAHESKYWKSLSKYMTS
jgi:hypothetical protein